ncbi:MAG: preprotein translocase subunit SecA [Planctomycetes bacterium GWF2_41_51]|nr:MAG: preprotein translocase subunit SecA [Planctomycetes bacterium GWF2_41_51]HBG27437.1 preprotein translocase subunit SecA [Phycisphaerales bacterium]
MAKGSISRLLVKLFGSRNERLVKGYMHKALAAGEYEEQIKSLNDDALKAKTQEFKDRLAQGQNPDDILSEAFAVVREAARRSVNMRHFNVQLIGGNVLYDGRIAEMATGEGKTLVATLAAYLVHLTGKKVHIVTVNDYLAKRDSEWMGPIYKMLGLNVGAIQADMDTSGDDRKAQYGCDITYGTNNEFGFDYLRDNMKVSAEQLAQGPLDYAIIDEVDSILIDEARTPLIISGPAFDDVSRYKKADGVARQLIKMQSEYDRTKQQLETAQKTLANAQGELSDAKKAKDDARVQKAQSVIEKSRQDIETFENRLSTSKQYYEVEYDRKSAHLNHDGTGAAQDLVGVGSFFVGANTEWKHLIEQSLRAHTVFEREKDYVVMDGKVVIVDEFTGRLMHGRQWSDGLHQAVEAKENVTIKEESQTLATITLQNFFRLYKKIAGMTGTAATEADEFSQIYKLEVITIPTNKPCVRDDKDDMIYKSLREKFNAIVDEIHQVSTAGRPVLVGTISVEKSEAISNALTKKYGLEHEVLNAKQHAREALIVEKAGHQHTDRRGNLCGNVTIATNMAGRGTDIKLSASVLFEIEKIETNPAAKDTEIYTIKQGGTENLITYKSTDPLANVFHTRGNQKVVGGLHIVGTERHEARRIDNQLRGRAGRQGDPGSSQFFLSFDDDLMQLFGGERIPKLLSLVGWKEDEPILHRTISRQIEKVQKKVEQRNFEARKSLLEYDEVMDYQRKTFYSRRRQVIEGRELKEVITAMIDGTIDTAVSTILAEGYQYKGISEWARTAFGVDISPKRFDGAEAERVEEIIKKTAKNDASNNISVTLGEYLEDFEDRNTWNIESLVKWAMTTFSVNLSGSKIRQMTAEEIEQNLIEASAEQIDKKDCSIISTFLDPEFGIKSFTNWAFNKFAIKLEVNELKDLKPEQVYEKLLEQVQARYARREIEYPIEFAMSMTFRGDSVNVYAFENLSRWIKDRFGADMPVTYLQTTSPNNIHKELLKISEEYHSSGLEKEIDEQIASASSAAVLAEWTNNRFNAKLSAEQLEDKQSVKETLLKAGKDFLRTELSELEKYILLQYYDSAWKDHLYSMDRLKESIFMRAYAEKDPKIEYKQEGFKMFSDMLDLIQDKVTDTIFKVRLEAGTRTRNVWQAGRTQHKEVDHFEVSEQQRAAAQAPQGEAAKVKQIVHEKPKVGRNDPCPCGSGKKYKKCHGANA